MRLSSYNIYVPLANGSETILVHGITGAVDRVDNEWASNMRALRWDRFSDERCQLLGWCEGRHHL